MFFTVGIETPHEANTAYGLSIPAFDKYGYGCVSAADEQADIPVMAREAILTIIEEIMLAGTYSIEEITDDGVASYSKSVDYRHCETWFMLDIDLSVFEGKQQRLNITLPDILVKRIDGFVAGHRLDYKDRSHFLAQAARRELANRILKA
ncbi:type II toxin-antitoxin system HicB family antitoxin [Rosenbergiella nectarea]|uniref:type II toxin-antitoxin system HicB family antitoxin n=1 Tax=Rosenbergiella nectarea TaxID=988801 RepID=UPI001BDB4084|nr:type II toxin-antitoxin system HicB family antitoxin [Rosenbergiella nectarea]MBT0728741.1 CopG family transcriptional regulator [Rosenbergiella nectarea subsp. apis]